MPNSYLGPQVYASTSRDSLLAAVRDVLQTEVGRCVVSLLVIWIPCMFG